MRPRTPLEAAVFDKAEVEAEAPAPAPAAPTPTPPTVTAPVAAPAISTPEPVAPAATAPPTTVRAVTPTRAETLVERPLPAPARPTVFGLGRAAYVEGDFVAALRNPAGRWVSVRPQPEGFPNSWQRRVLLWFGLSFAVVAPVGYLFARRLTAPLRHFADAAERLGRDPTTDIAPLRGPAEVGRAAGAFNLMGRRLKRYVEDRTGMVGAISHDLRTPLARMRFKLERAPPALRAALDRDISQMEEMITSVLSFMRDDAIGTARAAVDLRSILECVVDDLGGEARLAPGPPLIVEVDVLAIQRVFENLVDNALKYGGQAEVRLSVEASEAVVEVADDGPGLSDEDLGQVFKPFFRTADAKATGKAGVGLGLAVSRSAIRAHGGELSLRRATSGLIAEVRLPLAGPISASAAA